MRLRAGSQQQPVSKPNRLEHEISLYLHGIGIFGSSLACPTTSKGSKETHHRRRNREVRQQQSTPFVSYPLVYLVHYLVPCNSVVRNRRKKERGINQGPSVIHPQNRTALHCSHHVVNVSFRNVVLTNPPSSSSSLHSIPQSSCVVASFASLVKSPFNRSRDLGPRSSALQS